MNNMGGEFFLFIKKKIWNGGKGRALEEIKYKKGEDGGTREKV